MIRLLRRMPDLLQCVDLRLIPYPYIGHSSEYFSRVVRPRKHMGIAVGISLLLRTQPKIQVLYMYFRFMAAILIFDMDFCREVPHSNFDRIPDITG